MNDNNLIKINIGSGPDGKSNWINLDWGILPVLSKIPFLYYLLIKIHILPEIYYKKWPNLYLTDCRKKLPFKNSSVDFIYTSHFIEHLYRYQAEKLLVECRRILRPEGILRICIPDLKTLSEKYINNDKNFFLTLDANEYNLQNLSDLFIQHFYGYNSWTKPNFIQKIQRLFIRGHLWMYDYDSLSILLHNAGFSGIKRCLPTQGKTPDIEYLDIHKTGSLFIEASNN